MRKEFPSNKFTNMISDWVWKFSVAFVLNEMVNVVPQGIWMKYWHPYKFMAIIGVWKFSVVTILEDDNGWSHHQNLSKIFLIWIQYPSLVLSDSIFYNLHDK